MLTEMQTNACSGQTKRNDGINCTHENMLKHFNISRKEEILIENKCHFCRDNNKYFQRVLAIALLVPHHNYIYLTWRDSMHVYYGYLKFENYYLYDI